MHKSKNILIAVVAIVFCIILILGILFIPKINEKNKLEKMAAKYMEIGNYEEAIKAYNKLIDKTNDDKYIDKVELGKKLLNSEEKFVEGEREFSKGNYEKAVSNLKEVLKEDKKNYENSQNVIEEIKSTFNNDISESISNEKFDDAESKISKYIKIFGEDENIKTYLANIEKAKNDEKEAKEKEELASAKEELEKARKELEERNKTPVTAPNPKNTDTSGNYVVTDKAYIYSSPGSSKSITWVSKGATVDIQDSTTHNGELWYEGRVTSIVTGNSYVAWIKASDVN